MPDYKKLYYKSFSTIAEMEGVLTKCAEVLREFQKECEDICIEDEEDRDN